MNIVMKMMKIKTIEDKYNDLTDLTTHWQDFYSSYNEDSVVDLLCEVNVALLREKEELYLRMQRRKKMKQLPMKVGRIALSMIPKDEFNRRYKR